MRRSSVEDGPTSGFIVPGKVNMVIDGQFGSTGKGLISARIATDNHIDLCVARLSPNAGHTFYLEGKKYVSKLIPVSAVIQENSTIFISAGSVIHVPTLLREMEEFDIAQNRLQIHPRTSVVQDAHIDMEKDVSFTRIASTGSGSGAARIDKIARTARLAEDTTALKKYICHMDFLSSYLRENLNVFVETGQGYDLSINHGYKYPYCTSVDITPSAVLADLNAHPSDLGNVMLSMRTYPIRVGNPVDKVTGKELGYSGPVYPDSEEIMYVDINQPEELTTVTKRVRRLFTFSKIQYERSVRDIRPSHIFLNFINYVKTDDVITRFNELNMPPTHVGYGKYTHEVEHWDSSILENYVYKYT